MAYGMRNRFAALSSSNTQDEDQEVTFKMGEKWVISQSMGVSAVKKVDKVKSDVQRHSFTLDEQDQQYRFENVIVSGIRKHRMEQNKKTQLQPS